MERVIVFLLSQIMERPSLFSLHPPKESCKVLWKDDQAVGFYTVKHKGGQRTMRVIGKGQKTGLSRIETLIKSETA